MTITWCAMKYQDFFITLTSIVLSNFIKKRNDYKVNAYFIEKTGKGVDALVVSEPKPGMARPVLQLTDDQTIIKEYPSLADAVRETGISSKSIRDAAKGVKKHAGGYCWRYADE